MGVELPPLPPPDDAVNRVIEGIDVDVYVWEEQSVRAYATIHASNLQGEVERLRAALEGMLAACPDANNGRLGLSIRVTQDNIDACRNARRILYPDALSTR